MPMSSFELGIRIAQVDAALLMFGHRSTRAHDRRAGYRPRDRDIQTTSRWVGVLFRPQRLTKCRP
jgi:hypothetical protein